MRTLYVGGLSPQIDVEALQAIFAPFGAQAARIVRAQGGQTRGFGYVTFADSAAATAAKRAWNGKVYEGARLRVDLAQ